MPNPTVLIQAKIPADQWGAGCLSTYGIGSLLQTQDPSPAHCNTDTCVSMGQTTSTVRSHVTRGGNAHIKETAKSVLEKGTDNDTGPFWFMPPNYWGVLSPNTIGYRNVCVMILYSTVPQQIGGICKYISQQGDSTGRVESLRISLVHFDCLNSMEKTPSL